MTYRWFADEEVGTTILWDMADMRSNRHHGAFGQLIVEPEGAEWFDSNGQPTITSREAIIADPNGENFREFALSMSDARYVINDDGSCVVP
jgi:manganese oxidase